MKEYAVPYIVEQDYRYGDPYYVYSYNVRYYPYNDSYKFCYNANLTAYNLYEVRLRTSSLNDLKIWDSGRIVGDYL